MEPLVDMIPTQRALKKAPTALETGVGAFCCLGYTWGIPKVIETPLAAFYSVLRSGMKSHRHIRWVP